jgi:hypothetical protein
VPKVTLKKTKIYAIHNGKTFKRGEVAQVTDEEADFLEEAVPGWFDIQRGGVKIVPPKAKAAPEAEKAVDL